MTSCTIQDCTSLGGLKDGKRFWPRGYCIKHYRRLMRYGDPLAVTQRDKRPAIIEGDIAKIPLGKNAMSGYAIVDKDFASLDKYRWYAINGYAATWINNRNVKMHTMILEVEPPFVVDHINRDRLDNRRENLRAATIQQNAVNSKPRKGRSIKGVYKRGDEWEVAVYHQYKRINGGTYKTIDEAIDAYNALATKYHGEYASLNNLERLGE